MQSFRQLVAKEPEIPPDPTLQELRYYPLDPNWSRQAFSDPYVMRALQRLLLTQTVFDRTEVILDPGILRLHVLGNPSLFSVPLSPDQAREWMEALFELLNAIEALPPPEITAAPSELLKVAASIHKVNWLLVTIVLMGLMVFCMVAASAAITGLLVYFRP
jgi:hypothetical protein